MYLINNLFGDTDHLLVIQQISLLMDYQLSNWLTQLCGDIALHGYHLLLKGPSEALLVQANSLGHLPTSTAQPYRDVPMVHTLQLILLLKAVTPSY